MRRQTMYFMTTLTIVGVLSLTFLWLTSGVWAGVNGPQESAVVQVPVGTGFTYQGELQQSGSPASGKFDFRFRLFDAATGGSQVGSTVTKDDVQVTNGRFTVELDFGTVAFNGDARWLEIAVRPGSSTGAYTVLSPRQPLRPVPYALYALNGGGESNAHDHLGQTWTGAYTTGLHIRNTRKTGEAHALLGETDSSEGYGVVGLATSTSGAGYGVAGVSASAYGIGVWGIVTSTEGSAIGVVGQSNSVDGAGMAGYGVYTGTIGSAESFGVFGNATSEQGIGVLGVRGLTTWTAYFNPAEHSAAVVGFSFTDPIGGIQGSEPIGVLGVGQTYPIPLGLGEFGETIGVKGVGTRIGVEGTIYGIVEGGITYGVLGRTNGPLGAGVVGIAESTYFNRHPPYGPETAGVLGVTYDEESAGVYASSNYTGTSPSYGLIATTASSSGYAGLFEGDVDVRGTLTKQSGAFKIDHPLDPANKYLYHSFVESPDMKNIYDGVVVLDENGEAWVELPDWFEALNKDFRYQLTPIGASMPGLYIAEEIKDNRFKIAGGAPGKKVSWQVTGIRNDPWAQQNRIPVEQEKPDDEKGTYLFPEGYGQPKEKRTDYDLFNRAANIER